MTILAVHFNQQIYALHLPNNYLIKTMMRSKLVEFNVISMFIKEGQLADIAMCLFCAHFVFVSHLYTK